MSLFDAYEQMVSNAVDAHLGRSLTFTPQGSAQRTNLGKPIAFDGRAAVVVRGTFIQGTEETSFIDGDRRMSSFNARASRHDSVITVDVASFPAGWLPKVGDLVETDHNPPRRFGVLKILPQGTVRLAIFLEAA